MGVRTISADVLAGWLRSGEPPRLIDVLTRAHFERTRRGGDDLDPERSGRGKTGRSESEEQPQSGHWQPVPRADGGHRH